MLPTNEPRLPAPSAAPRPARLRRKGPPRRGPSRGTRVIAFEMSVGLHFLLFLAMLSLPHADNVQPPTVAKESPIPVEVAFVPQSTQVAAKVAPPGPKLKPVPEPLPRAVEAPKHVPQRTQATAIRPKKPKPAMKPAKVAADKQAERHVETHKPDLSELLASRVNRGKQQEEERLAALAAKNHEGSETASKETAAGVPHGDPVTSGSGVSGELASRSLLRRIDPQYPPVAMHSGDEGTVTLRLYVSPGGAVSRVEITRSSGRGYFDRAAQRAAQSWAFNPAPEGTGQQYGDVTMSFRLRR